MPERALQSSRLADHVPKSPISLASKLIGAGFKTLHVAIQVVRQGQFREGSRPDQTIRPAPPHAAWALAVSPTASAYFR